MSVEGVCYLRLNRQQGIRPAGLLQSCQEHLIEYLHAFDFKFVKSSTAECNTTAEVKALQTAILLNYTILILRTYILPIADHPFTYLLHRECL